MTIDKAIKILRTFELGMAIPYGQNTKDALNLSIEALKAVKACRESHMFCPGLIMPGETEE